MSYQMDQIGSHPFSRGGQHGSQNTNDEAELERLRGLARTEKNRQHDLARQSQEAYQRGDGAEASQLSQEAKRHEAQADAYNKQASEFIFRANNSQQSGDVIDLHGLYVQEAVQILTMRINAARSSGQKGLHVIVGKGIHSQDHVQKIKPAVEQLCQEQNLEYSTEHNAGRMYISFDGPGVGEVPASNHADAYAAYPAAISQQSHHQGQGQHHNNNNNYNNNNYNNNNNQYQQPSYQNQQQPQYGNQQQQYGGGQNQYQQQGGYQQNQQQQQHQNNPNEELQEEAIAFAKKNAPKFFRKLRECCVIM